MSKIDLTEDGKAFRAREAALPCGRDGKSVAPARPRGERGRRALRNANESALEKLLNDGSIGDPEYQAGLMYHKELCKSVCGSSVPDLDRAPGQDSYGGDVAQVEAVLWLERVNRAQGMSRAYRTVLSLALHPWENHSLSEIDRLQGYSKNMMQGKTVLIEALRELAVILGFSTHSDYENPSTAAKG